MVIENLSFIVDFVCWFCLDFDECMVENGGCAEECLNTDGGFYCLCPPGFNNTGDACESRSLSNNVVDHIDTLKNCSIFRKNR